MNNIQTILLDMDSITKFLARKKMEERSQYPMYESVIKEGIKSLSSFQVIAFTLGDKKHATKWLHTTHLNRLIPIVEAGEKNKPTTCEQLLKSIFLKKQLKRESTLIVSNNSKVLTNGKLLNIATCSCSLLYNQSLPQTDYQIKFLPELNEIKSSKKEKEQLVDTNEEKSTVQNLYIDQKTWDSLSRIAKLNLEKQSIQPITLTDQETFSRIPSSCLVLTKFPEVEIQLEYLGIPSCYLVTSMNDQVERKSTLEIPIKRLEKFQSLNTR